MPDIQDYSGTWHCSYWYPSNQHEGEDVSEYDVIAEQTGSQLVLQSVPNNQDSYILVRLMIDGVLAAGSWTENTEPAGEFAGMIYSGVIQLIIDADKKRMSGQWVGVGRDMQKQVPGVFGGRWEFTRID